MSLFEHGCRDLPRFCILGALMQNLHTDDVLFGIEEVAAIVRLNCYAVHPQASYVFAASTNHEIRPRNWAKIRPESGF
jgi:hypothetical protein